MYGSDDDDDNDDEDDDDKKTTTTKTTTKPHSKHRKAGLAHCVTRALLTQMKSSQ